MKKIKNCKFLISCENITHCPNSTLPEIGLLGRSNVGKSTLINTLANIRGLAKTSNTPGKTRLMNYFQFDEKFMIVDLPGYGYAKVSKAEQNRWEKTLCQFILEREQLKYCFQIVDARHGIQKNDEIMKDWLLHHNISEKAYLILNKCDLIKKSEIQAKIKLYKNWYKNEIFTFSAKDNYFNNNLEQFLLNL